MTSYNIAQGLTWYLGNIDSKTELTKLNNDYNNNNNRLESSFHRATVVWKNVCSFISRLRDNCPGDSEITPLALHDNQLVYLDWFRDLSQRSIIPKRSCDIHGEAWDVTAMFLTGMSPRHWILFPLLQRSEVFLSAGECIPWCFPDVLMAAMLTYQFTSNTSTSARPFSTSGADQTVDVVAFFFPECVWPL